MSASEFFFALDLSDDSRYDPMLAELTGAVCGHAGFAKPAADELAAALAGGLHDRAARGVRRCDVRFALQDGELQIVVSHEGGAAWQTRRRLP